jgi:hypothetical protein
VSGVGRTIRRALKKLQKPPGLDLGLPATMLK